MTILQKDPVTESKRTNARSSNLELYRILTMLLIVAHHYVVNSGLTAADGPVFADQTSCRSMFLLIFGAFGKTGINCFVLITGYFMCRSQITAQKFCKLIFEILFYRLVIWFLFWVSGYSEFSFTEFIKLFLPVRAIATGFASCYLVFFLFIPFINILIHNLSEIQHIKLLLLCAFMYIIIGMIPGFGITMNYVSWFIVIYLVGAYIRMYEKDFFSNTRFWGVCFFGASVISALSVVAMAWLGAKFGKSVPYFFLSDCNRPLAVILAICSFMFFKNLNIRNSKFINTVSASTFGVLLIHANSDTMRQWLWKDALNNVGMYHSDWLALHAVGSVAAVYIVCTLLDCLRIRFIEIPFFNMWNKLWAGISKRYTEAEKEVCKRLKIQS